MIYVQRDASIIPKKLLDMAAKAQATLETLNGVDRLKFIRKKSRIWRLFGRYLSRMSYGKCWYSESPDPQSFFDIDHYRPKLAAKRSETEIDTPGYEWLAFSWENFRYSANCSNRLRENIETGAVNGKGCWFPLIEGSEKASWRNRCEARENPVLLDPVIKADVDLIEVQADGRMGPSRLAVGSAKYRVTRSCELYGLNLPPIKSARMRIMREVQEMVDVLCKMLDAANDESTPIPFADRQPIKEQCAIIRNKTLPSSPYSRAARVTLMRAGYPDLRANPEEMEAAAE